ncbi:toll/interleukin-1 receptor domain-containing protein [Rhizobium johnstonii]
MARIFISHSSLDDEAAARMNTWLKSQGFETTFLDFDKTSGIAPGANWEKTLYREGEQSQAVIVIQTPNWLASKWCFAESPRRAGAARQSFWLSKHLRVTVRFHLTSRRSDVRCQCFRREEPTAQTNGCS